MRQMIGTVIFAVAAIVVAVLAVALHWPWSWWVWILIAVPCAVAGVLMLWPEQKSPESQSAGSGKTVVTAKGKRSVAVNKNSGIISTGDDATIER